MRCSIHTATKGPIFQPAFRCQIVKYVVEMLIVNGSGEILFRESCMLALDRILRRKRLPQTPSSSRSSLCHQDLRSLTVRFWSHSTNRPEQSDPRYCTVPHQIYLTPSHKPSTPANFYAIVGEFELKVSVDSSRAEIEVRACVYPAATFNKLGFRETVETLRLLRVGGRPREEVTQRARLFFFEDKRSKA